MKTRYVEQIIHDIREVISSESLSSDNSSDSEPDCTHRPVSRTISEQQCNVTVSVRPRRIHSDRVINQLAVGRVPNSKGVGKNVNPTQTNSAFMPPSNVGIKSPMMAMGNSGEDVFSFDDKLGLYQGVKSRKETLQKAANWKTSTTFSKTMMESRSDNEHSSNDYEEEIDGHQYVDIIADGETSDEASTLLAQVVADLTEPQKRNCFVKSNSTGGIQGKPLEMNEGRRASAPVVGSKEYSATSEASEIDAHGSLSNTQWKLKLEKINEVSFVEATDNSESSISQNGQTLLTRTNSAKNERARSMSELLAVELEMPTRFRPDMQRSKTLLNASNSCVGSSLTDLSSARHKGLRAAISLSPTSNILHQLEKDSTHFGFTAGSGKVPSFPKSSVVKAVENVGGLENSRAIFSMSPLPPEFHAASDDSFDTDADQVSPVSLTSSETIPPRPPKDTEVRRIRSKSRSPPPPLPERSPSLPLTKERTDSLKNGTLESAPSTKPYANAPPKVHPRMPNTVPLQSSGTDYHSDGVAPPPRPPKPESLSSSVRKTVSEHNRQLTAVFTSGGPKRLFGSEKRNDTYPWGLDREYGSLQLGILSRPIVTVTPPGTLKFNKKTAVSVEFSFPILKLLLTKLCYD